MAAELYGMTARLLAQSPRYISPCLPRMLPSPHDAAQLRGLSAWNRTTPVGPQPLALCPQLTAYACLTPWQARTNAGRRPAAAPAPVGALERVRLLRGLWAAPREEAVEVRGWLLSNSW